MKKLKYGLIIVEILLVLFTISFFTYGFADTNVVKVGLNYPRTGPYSVQGLDQLRAAQLAIDEINALGGILGKNVEIVWRDSESRVSATMVNVAELIEKEKVKMVFGGSSSSVAIAASNVCQEKKVPFFGTLTYSTATTGINAHRYTFRECYNSWMAAKSLASYLKENFPSDKNRYFYITANYTWGRTTELSVRQLTGTQDVSVHRGIKTPFPSANSRIFKKAIAFAKMVDPDVLVLVLFGKDMTNAIKVATLLGIKSKMQIIVPNLTIGMAEGAGPEVMEGVIGALPWCWQVPYKYNYPKGKLFVENFEKRYNRYPGTSGASAYTILYEYKYAVERAKSFDAPYIIKALEDHKYISLKDEQYWRAFDHQSVQTVYAVKCKSKSDVLKDKYKLDFFEIIESIPGEQAVRTRDEWNLLRTNAGKSISLEKL